MAVRSTSATLTVNKSGPIEGKCALAHWTDAGTTHVCTHDHACTPHLTPATLQSHSCTWGIGLAVQSETTIDSLYIYTATAIDLVHW